MYRCQRTLCTALEPFHSQLTFPLLGELSKTPGSRMPPSMAPALCSYLTPLTKVLVYFQACSTSLQAPQRLGPQQIHPDILRIGVQKPEVLNGCQGLKTTGVPKVSQTDRGTRESWSPPCPGHILPGHRMEERPHRPRIPGATVSGSPPGPRSQQSPAESGRVSRLAN